MSAVELRPTPVATAAPPPAKRPPAVVRRSDALAPMRGLALRAARAWLPRATWTVARTGRPGFVGLALLLSSAVFFASTHLPVAGEVASLRDQLTSAQRQRAAAPRAEISDAARALQNLPRRAEMPALLGVLLKQADEARLTLDTGKYEAITSRSGDIIRYKLSFPVTGPYPQVRQFIDATLTAMPAVAISELSIERKAIGDGVVEAQIRLTVFMRSTP